MYQKKISLTLSFMEHPFHGPQSVYQEPLYIRWNFSGCEKALLPTTWMKKWI
ncbi:hypothetical protein [Peribacillus butanolivorans]|uniref:hypothetical protein n=1 Tax=Peribacillus butanolivorans TaxID=421767 RepID=UPI003D07146F